MEIEAVWNELELVEKVVELKNTTGRRTKSPVGLNGNDRTTGYIVPGPNKFVF